MPSAKADAIGTDKDGVDKILAALADPDAVYQNMLRGLIAKPSMAQCAHLHGETELWNAARRVESAGADAVVALQACRGLADLPGSVAALIDATIARLFAAKAEWRYRPDHDPLRAGGGGETVTAEQVEAAIKAHGVTEWRVSKCSICDEPLFYRFVHDGAFFDPNCGCPVERSPLERRTYDNVAHKLNSQTPDVRAEMWRQIFGQDASGTAQRP